MKKIFKISLAILLIVTLSACSRTSTDSSDKDIVESITNSITSTDKGKEYTYLFDQWNLYTATFLSDTTINIESLYRFDASYTWEETGNDPVSVMTVKTSDNDFLWLDDSHTAFSITMHDDDNYSWKEDSTAVFSIVDDKAAVLGTNCTESAITYSYQHDKWNLYRAIILSDNLIKIESWNRFDASIDWTPNDYEDDFAIIDISNGSTDFEWVDDDHSSFTITLCDEDNYYWENDEFVAFILDDTETKAKDKVEIVEVPSEDIENNSNTNSNGVSDDFKETMDAYEQFFNEYVDFMQDYDSTDLNQVKEYASLMTTYANYMQELADLEDEKLSDEDYAYYIEVNSRIMDKLSSVQ